MTPDQRIREIEKLAAPPRARIARRCVVVSLDVERAKRQQRAAGIQRVAATTANKCVQMFADASKPIDQSPVQGDLFKA